MTQTDRLSIYRTMPQAIEALTKVETLLHESDLDPLLRHFVKLRVSQINGCAFCVDMHIREARGDGETAQRIDMVVVWQNTDLFSAAEKAALAWAEALTTRGQDADLDTLHRALREHFREEQVDALTLVVVMINNWNRLQIANHNKRF